MRKKAKIILVPVQRGELHEYINKVLYRIGGIVKIHSVGITIDFTYESNPKEVIKLDKGEGFYRPAALIVNPCWVGDRVVPIRVSEYRLVRKYLLVDDQRFVIEPENKQHYVTKVFITDGYAHKHNPFKPGAQDRYSWPIIEQV